MTDSLRDLCPDAQSIVFRARQAHRNGRPVMGITWKGHAGIMSPKDAILVALLINLAADDDGEEPQDLGRKY
jgi:hypothetical protein